MKPNRTKYLLVLLACMLQVVATSQSVVFPKVKPFIFKILSQKSFEIKESWTPTDTFLKTNPKVLTTGAYSFNQVFNSQNYPAVFRKNEANIQAPGRIYVSLNWEPELPDLDGSNTPYQHTDYIPISDKSYDLGEAPNAHYISALPKDITKEKYVEDVKSMFTQKGATNLMVLPVGSFNLTKQEIKPTDLFFEFNYDYQDFIKTGKDKLSDGCGFYHLTIRDASGKILKTYGQTVFMTILLLKYGKYWTSTYLAEYIFGSTYMTAMECLLNQYTADNSMKISATQRSTALRIQAASDKSFIQLYTLQAEAHHYRLCQKEIIRQLQDLDKKIKGYGGAGVDMSGVKMPTTTSVVSSQIAAGGAAIAGIAVLIANAVQKKMLKDLEKEAARVKTLFQPYADDEKKAVDKYNTLLYSGNVTDINRIGKPGIEATNLETGNQENVSMENFWDEGAGKANTQQNKRPAKKYATPEHETYTITAARPAPDQAANMEGFWDEGGNKNTSNKSSGKKEVKATPISEQQLIANTYSTEPKARTEERKKNEVHTPTFHKVLPGETLYRLALVNGVTVDDLKRWNNLKGALEVGTNLIVGYP